MGLDYDGLVSLVGASGIDVVAHDVAYQRECIVLIEVVEPLEGIVRCHKALEHTGLGVEILIQRLGGVMDRGHEIYRAGCGEDGCNCAERYIYLFHI